MKLRANQVDWEAKQIQVPLNRGKQDITGKREHQLERVGYN